ncbi:hypothetical protein PHLGIDRAFT_117263 [Phlebiopsis gigantea 11061_1 CR5-6]|uniref:BTB domain-containing protein n=1 Tax=Phlebiopsis gigantea (strain 11061_1 CR5-6) TaxID=745531 RepID=A0A0C3PNK2_PHLG1|nr:hypothetical protein PHLGIDRAFT_117263 [Phlebiopsis gigantea 11061_1 CR5-6]
MYAEGEYYPDRQEPKRQALQPYANPRIAVGSPSEDRPITPGAVSDELSFAKWRTAEATGAASKAAAKKANKKKNSALRESIYSGADSPGSAFAETVNKNTGFSPLNPTRPLQDAFHSTLSPPPGPKPVLMVHTPSPSPPPPRREFLLDPARATEGLPVSSKPSTPSPLAETPIRPAFSAVRPQLFQKALLDSIRGVPFDDTDIHLCSARSKGGIVHRPLPVHARHDFLCAASTVFAEELYHRCGIDPSAAPERRSSRIEYGYDCDSDLEDCEDDRPPKPQAAPPKAQPPATSPRPLRSRSSTSVDSQATPKSAALSATDIDVVSLDDFNSLSLSSDDNSDSSKGKDAQRRPSLNVETNVSVLSWRDDHMKDTAIPIKRVERQPEEIKLPSSPEETILVKYEDGARKSTTLFIPGSAYRTWQALLLYLYNDSLEFAPLRSQRDVARPDARAVAASPKSMYRLAAKLGLEQLKDKSFSALREVLSKENIVEELFSDFTWRYPEVLQMETEVFHRYASEVSVQTALSEKFQEIAYGQLPHSSMVLSSLFKKFVGAPGGAARK